LVEPRDIAARVAPTDIVNNPGPQARFPILNSLLVNGLSCLVFSNPMILRRFRRRAFRTVIKFPVIFPVSREFARLKINR